MFDDQHGSGIRFYFGACCMIQNIFWSIFSGCSVSVPLSRRLIPRHLILCASTICLSADIFLSEYLSVSPCLCLSLSPSDLSHVFT